MSLTTSLKSQQPHQHDEPSSEFHGQLDGPRDGGDTSTSLNGQQALPGITDPAYPGPPRSLGPSAHAGFDLPGWKCLTRGPLATHERISLIKTIFSNRDEIEMIKRLCGEDAQIFIDTIYETLDDLDHALRMRCLRFLCKICGRHGLLPKSLTIPVSYDQTKAPLYRGGFADVWKGTSRSQEVAVKVMGLYQCSDQQQIRRGFCKEVMVWSTLRHPNVLPLLGATMTDVQFVMVSEWMVNGNINEFLKVNPNADRLGLLRDVGRGLDYLHGQEIIHGDLKGANILINRDGDACITDFSLLVIIPDKTDFISAISCIEGGTLRWTSPELLDPEPFGLKDGCQTKESDCYALGMVVYEILSGRRPFSQYKDTIVIRKVMDGERPERPRGRREKWFTDGLWGMLELCWKPQPQDRPSLKALLQCLEGVTGPSRTSSPTPTVDEDTGTDTDDSLDFTVTNLAITPGDGWLSVPPQTTTLGTADPIRVEGGIIYEENKRLVTPVTQHQQFASGLIGKTQTLNTVAGPPPKELPGPSSVNLEDIIKVPQNFPPITPEDLAKLGVEAQVIPFIISTIMQVEQPPGGLPPLTPVEVENLAEILDKVVSSTTASPHLKNRCFKVLRKVSPTHGVLPKSYFLPGVTLSDTVSYASGGFADVWKGQLDGNQVCVKAFQTRPPRNLDKIKRRFYREIVGWKYVLHPNVLPFLGVSETLFPFCIVSPWLVNGNITEYIQKHQGVNRLHLLAQAACGLEYLHSLSIVHSDINPGNILITEEGNARLGDFGITGIITKPTTMDPASPKISKPGVFRYMAPELLNPLQFKLLVRNPSKESDVYSLAMTAFEVLTGILPYGQNGNGIIIFQVATGERPTRPANARWLQDHIWTMITACWSESREQRWGIHAVYNQFLASATEVSDIEPDVEITQTLRVAAPKDPSPTQREAKTKPPKTAKMPRSQRAAVTDTQRESILKKSFRFLTFRRGGDAGEPGAGLDVRERRTRKLKS